MAAVTHQIQKQALRVEQHSVVCTRYCSCNLPSSLQAKSEQLASTAPAAVAFGQIPPHIEGGLVLAHLDFPEGEESRVLLDGLTD